MESKLCPRCNLERPFPGDYVTNYNKQQMGTICKLCRKTKRAVLKRKYRGSPVFPKGWGETMPAFKREMFREQEMKKTKE